MVDKNLDLTNLILKKMNEDLMKETNESNGKNMGLSHTTAHFGWQDHFGPSMLQFGYIDSYKTAADILIDHCMPDLLMFPIIFCYRQYLELLLKNINSGYKININNQINHNLLGIWNVVLPFLRKNHSEEEIQFIGVMIGTFNLLDPGSLTFRYVTTKGGQSTLREPFNLNLIEIRQKIDVVDDILRYTYDSV